MKFGAVIGMLFLFIAGCSSSAKNPHGFVKVGEGDTGPSQIDREGIRKTFLNHQREIQTCYSSALNAKKDLAGKLVIDFEIIVEGKVGRTAIAADKSNFRDDVLEKCLLGLMKDWTFPPPPENQTVQVFYPLAFLGK